MSVAQPADVARLRAVDIAWNEALERALSAGFGRAIDLEGELLDPLAALPRAQLPPGPYRCRLVRLGAGRRPFAAFPPFFCHVGAEEGGLSSFTKQTGSERPGGYLWPDGEDRMVFLGALAAAGEAGPPAYGDDPGRDRAGIVERIGPFRYRLVLPTPAGAGTIDIFELLPIVDAY